MSGKQKFSCANCGVTVMQYPSQLRGKTVHCSRACYRETQKLRSPVNKGAANSVSKPCAQCGQAITGVPSLVKRRRFCSAACTALAFTGTVEAALSNYRIENDCWVWQGSLRGGYGRLRRAGKSCQAHRVSYERHVGPIPEGLVVDHLCRNRACINPAHLEPVTQLENIQRGEQGSPQAMTKHWNTRRGGQNDPDSRNRSGAG